MKNTQSTYRSPTQVPKYLRPFIKYSTALYAKVYQETTDQIRGLEQAQLTQYTQSRQEVIDMLVNALGILEQMKADGAFVDGDDPEVVHVDEIAFLTDQLKQKQVQVNECEDMKRLSIATEQNKRDVDKQIVKHLREINHLTLKLNVIRARKKARRAP